MATITYLIPGISCNHCVHTIKTELMEIPGVKNVSGDPVTKKVDITFEPPATLEKMEAVLVEINFPPAK